MEADGPVRGGSHVRRSVGHRQAARVGLGAVHASGQFVGVRHAGSPFGFHAWPSAHTMPPADLRAGEVAEARVCVPELQTGGQTLLMASHPVIPAAS